MDRPAASSPRQERAFREAETLTVSLGPDFCRALAEPGVVELYLNDDGRVWLERLGVGKAVIGTMEPDAAETFILAAAGLHRRTVDHTASILECDLPAAEPFRRARFAATLPPVSPAPAFNIRMLAASVFTLAEYERQGIMTPCQRAEIEAALTRRENVLIAGGTGTGKTTLTNACLAHIEAVTPEHRLVILEETPELQCAAPDVTFLRTSQSADLQALLRTTLRRRPDRIIVGEVRGAESLAMLKAWNTGHPGGVSTIHANGSARAALIRLEHLIAESGQTPIPALIAETINLIACINHDPGLGRRIREVVRVCGFDGQTYTLQHLENPL